MDKTFSLRDLSLMAADNTSHEVTLGLLFGRTHQDTLTCVEKAMSFLGSEFSKTRQERYQRDEDELTADLILGLKAMGLQASHDTAYGGHVDIVIEARNQFLWVGEAKIHGTYDWLLKGFMQLTTRYSTGLPGQDNGGMVIYNKNVDTRSVMVNWRKYLMDNVHDIIVEDMGPGLSFTSKHKHQVSGLEFTVQHTSISLHFNPKDRGL